MFTLLNWHYRCNIYTIFTAVY